MTFSRRATVGFFFAAVCSLAAGCSKHEDPWEKVKGGPPRVVVSIPPLYSFVKQVGGDKVGVICLCTETGPHEYEYNPRDAIAVRKADRLIGIGLGLDEEFLNKVQASSGLDGKKYVKLGEKFPADETRPVEGKDPHVWMGLHMAKKLVRLIAAELKEADPANAAYYEKNADDYCKKLDAVRAEYKAKFEKKVSERVMPMHDALQYFGQPQALDDSPKPARLIRIYTEAIELQPGDQPGSARMKKLVDICTDADEPDPNKRQPIHLLATEPQYEDKVAETLKRELKKNGIDVVLFEIDPLETADPKELDADWYEMKMRKNLDALLDHLKDKK